MTRRDFDRLREYLRSAYSELQNDYDSTDIDWDLIVNDLEHAATLARIAADHQAEAEGDTV